MDNNSKNISVEKIERKNVFLRFINTVGRQDLALICVLLGLMICFTLINTNFIKPYNLLSMVQNLVPYTFLALGVMFVIAAGHTDLSVGAVCIASAVIGGYLLKFGMPLWGVIPVTLAVGLLFGCINGYLVSYVKVPAFIATLGTMMFVRGISAIIVVNPKIIYPNGTWFNKLFSNYNGFPTGIIWILVFTVIAAYIMNKNKIGRYILAIGSNSESARLSGIRTKKFVFIAYIISGVAAGIAGIFWAASFPTIEASTGNGMEFDAIAAVFIGGTGAAGGTASVTGSVLGMMMLTVIRSGINFALSRFNVNVNSTYVTYVMTGIIIVGAIILDIRKKKSGLNINVQAITGKKAKLKNILVTVIVAVLILAGIGACVAKISVENSVKNKTIAVIGKEETSSFWLSVKEGCIQAGKDMGYEVIYKAPSGTQASNLNEALSLMQTALSNNPSGLVVAAICEGYKDYLKQAYDDNVPVVQFDSGIYEKDIKELDAIKSNPIKASVITDNYAAAGLCATNTFNKIKSEIASTAGKYPVGIIQYEQSEPADNRSNGFKETFMKLAESDSSTKGKCEFFVEVKPDGTNNNYKAALEALAEKKCKMIFVANILSCESVCDAISSSNGRYDDIRFASFDCCTKQIEWVKNTNGPLLVGAVAQDTFEMGYNAVKNAINLAEGKSVEGKIVIDGIWYDRSNVDALYKKGKIYD